MQQIIEPNGIISSLFELVINSLTRINNAFLILVRIPTCWLV